MKSVRKKVIKKERIFLDYASATPIRDEALKAMRKYLSTNFANPSALYSEGVEARMLVESSRKQIASSIGAQPDEIIFTSSGTESDNLALYGVLEASREYVKNPHIIISSFEHPAVLRMAERYEKEGVEVSYAPITPDGFVTPESIRELLRPNTVLVSVMAANNEIGTIQDIRGIAREVRYFRKQKKKLLSYPYIHTDLGQLPLFDDCRPAHLGVDLLSLDSAKVYGPKGVAILYVRRGITLNPMILGGGQENGMRSGTENVLAIVGFGAAVLLNNNEQVRESKRQSELRDFLWDKIKSFAPDAHLNGSLERRLPNNVNICFPNQDSEYLVLKLDARGIAVSSSSSCRTLSENNSSYVVGLLESSHPCDTSSIRISIGRDTTKQEINTCLKALHDALQNP